MQNWRVGSVGPVNSGNFSGSGFVLYECLGIRMKGMRRRVATILKLGLRMLRPLPALDNPLRMIVALERSILWALRMPSHALASAIKPPHDCCNRQHNDQD